MQNTDFINDAYTIISLGNDCAVRYYLTMGGLKKSKSLGELSLPFDLSCHPTKSVVKILKNNFNDYFNNLLFKNGIWVNKKYKILYNHDKDCDENSKIKLIARFANRIENFNNIVKNSPYIFFVIKSQAKASEIINLYKVLRQKRNDLPFKLLVLDMDCKIRKEFKEKEIILFSKHHPFPKSSDWWKPEYKDSAQSIQYQNDICKFVENEIKKDFKVNKYNISNLK